MKYWIPLFTLAAAAALILYTKGRIEQGQWVSADKPQWEHADPAPKKPRDASHYNAEDLRTATLYRLKSKLPDLGYQSSESEIHLFRTKLKCEADWVSALPEGEVKDSYQSWIEYFEKEADRKAEDLKKGPGDDDGYERRAREYNALVTRSLALPIAKPPAQVCLPSEAK